MVTFTKLFLVFLSLCLPHLHLTEVRLLSPGTILSKLEKLTQHIANLLRVYATLTEEQHRDKLEKRKKEIERESELAIGVLLPFGDC
jgi:hypothetical protein